MHGMHAAVAAAWTFCDMFSETVLNAQDSDEERKRHGHEVDEFRKQLSQAATAL